MILPAGPQLLAGPPHDTCKLCLNQVAGQRGRNPTHPSGEPCTHRLCCRGGVFSHLLKGSWGQQHPVSASPSLRPFLEHSRHALLQPSACCALCLGCTCPHSGGSSVTYLRTRLKWRPFTAPACHFPSFSSFLKRSLRTTFNVYRPPTRIFFTLLKNILKVKCNVP